MQLFKNTKIDFIGHSRMHFILSSVMVLVSIFAIVKVKPIMSVEFTGGTLVQISFNELPPIDQIRNSLAKSGVQGFTVQTQPAHHTVIVRVPQRDGTSKDDVAVRIIEPLKADFAGNVKPLADRVDFIGPVIGKKLATNAIMAILGSLAVIVIYVAIRFRNWVWGVVGVLALAHDVFITFGLLVLLQREVTLVVVAALLTLAGYSINDTIVIFDRVRENLRSARKESLKEIYNRSVNETLSRNIIVSFLAFIAAASLFFGGEVLRDFALAMSFGIIIGSYSTIYGSIAAVYHWEMARKA